MVFVFIFSLYGICNVLFIFSLYGICNVFIFSLYGICNVFIFSLYGICNVFIFSGWLGFGGKQMPENHKEQKKKPKIEPATTLPSRFVT